MSEASSDAGPAPASGGERAEVHGVAGEQMVAEGGRSDDAGDAPSVDGDLSSGESAAGEVAAADGLVAVAAGDGEDDDASAGAAPGGGPDPGEVDGGGDTIDRAPEGRAAAGPNPESPLAAVRFGPMPQAWRPAVAYAVLAFALFVVVAGATAWLYKRYPTEPLPDGWGWLEGWVRFDAGWYRQIVLEGYFFWPTGQSSVAFFPLYPLAIRALMPLTGNVFLAGMPITLVSGFAVTMLFWRWCTARMTLRESRVALSVLLLWPFAYYLVGAIYGDALFLALVLGAFLLVERNHPILAGVVGAFATAARPVGFALILGLVLLVLERRGLLGRGAPRGGVRPWLAEARRRLRWSDAGVLLSCAGLGSYLVFLWNRFGDPFAFAVTAGAGWGQRPGPSTWLKFELFRAIGENGWGRAVWPLVLQGVLSLLFLALIPRVVRRFGWAYGLYTLLVAGFPILTSKDFVGVGRYLLAAFPVFALVGILLAKPSRVRVRVAWVAVSGTALVILTSMFARGWYIA